MDKPLGHKAYGSIPHLPESRLGPKDYHIQLGQAGILTKKTRDWRDLIIVQEKLDGSNVAIAKHKGKIIALTRSGYLATTSPYEQHHIFAEFVEDNKKRFHMVLEEGERISGEWMLQACSIEYNLPHSPFVAFDIFNSKNKRILYLDLVERIALIKGIVALPRLIHIGGPVSPHKLRDALKTSGHGAIGQPEGGVWRCERLGRVDFLAKWVRPDKEDGTLLNKEVYNTLPAQWAEYTPT